MIRLIGIVISIGLADSVNPSTVAPALYLSSLEHARERLTQFVLGVVLVYFVGGVAIALGPGQLLLSLVPKPSNTVGQSLEIVAGVALFVAAGLLIRHREMLSGKRLPTGAANSSSTFLLGAGIMVVELPTAFPYFAAIAAVVASGLGPVRQLILLAIFNFCFILPLLAMIVLLTVSSERAPAELARVRVFLERRWPLLLAVVAFVAGTFTITLGATGFASHAAGRIGRLSRGLHRRLRGLLHT